MIPLPSAPETYDRKTLQQALFVIEQRLSFLETPANLPELYDFSTDASFIGAAYDPTLVATADIQKALSNLIYVLKAKGII
ncbi:MAG: hypothetical protein IPO08_22205 [Xanthomonadales bacterium]|nr:hypothetical protein [Xanthomonadales bacterium]